MADDANDAETVLRIATVGDVDFLNRSLNSAFGRTFADELADQAAGEHTQLLAVRGSELLGSGFIRWLGPRDPAARSLYPQAPEILRLEVKPTYQGRGIGTRLIGALERNAVERGFRQVSLGVAHSNTRAYALYLRLGYQDTPLRSYFDEYQIQDDKGEVHTMRDLCRYLVRDLT